MKLLFIYLLLCMLFPAGAQVLPIKTYTVKDGLNSNSIYSVLRDKRGILWVGTLSGVNWYDGAGFSQPAMVAKGGQIYVNELYEDHHHNIWVLTFYNGLYKYDLEQNRFYNYFIDTTRLENNANNFFDMLELDDHNYLVATDFNVYLFDEHRFTMFDPGNKALHDQVSAAAQLSNGDILLGTTNGLWWYEKKGKAWKMKQLLYPGETINKILVYGQSCWIATNKGAMFFDNWIAGSAAAPKKFFLKDTLVNYVGRDNEGNIWFTSVDGAYKYRQDTLTLYTTANGLPVNNLHGVYRDEENNTWFYTEKGLAKLNNEYYRYYTLSDKNIPPGIMSASKAGNTLWFGYLGGILKMTGDRKEFITSILGKKAGYTFFINQD